MLFCFFFESIQGRYRFEHLALFVKCGVEQIHNAVLNCVYFFFTQFWHVSYANCWVTEYCSNFSIDLDISSFIKIDGFENEISDFSQAIAYFIRDALGWVLANESLNSQLGFGGSSGLCLICSIIIVSGRHCPMENRHKTVDDNRNFGFKKRQEASSRFMSSEIENCLLNFNLRLRLRLRTLLLSLINERVRHFAPINQVHSESEI